MCILVIGGHDRMHETYKNVGDKYGYEIKVFTHMTPRFEKSIGEPEGIVLFTNTVSHQMVYAAVKQAKKKNIPMVRNHSSGAASLEKSLKMLQLINLAPCS